MPVLYGNSMPFPYDFDYIELLRNALDCCVSLLSSQHTLTSAKTHSYSFEQLQDTEYKKLQKVNESAITAMEPFLASDNERAVAAASQVMEQTRLIIQGAINQLHSDYTQKTRHIMAVMEEEHRKILLAVQEFLIKAHELPGCAHQIHINTADNRYQIHEAVTTPVGLEAILKTVPPSSHLWGKARRVCDVLPGIEIDLPIIKTWSSKRTRVGSLRFDRLYISKLVVSDSTGLLWLRKSLTSGLGLQLSISNADNELAIGLMKITEEGEVENAEPIILQNEEANNMVYLWQHLIDTCHDLLAHRDQLISAEYESIPLVEIDNPKVIAERIVREFAPLTIEIAKRSGAPGELVLRKDLGEGRREEAYVTVAELLEKIEILPPDLQTVFNPLRLHNPPGLSYDPDDDSDIQDSMDLDRTELSNTHAATQRISWDTDPKIYKN